MRVIFMGTPEFAVPSLEVLTDHEYKPIAVVTGPDRPRGRGQRTIATPVKQAAERLGIDPILQPESVRDPEFAEAIRALDPELIVVVAFRILPPEVFSVPRFGSINLHGSLLPRYRGAAPINRAVMAGETETGVTTFFLRERVDTGSMILQRSMPIGPEETAGEVHDRMMHMGAEAVLDTVRLIDEGAAEALPQEDALATPAPKIFREDARIDWSRTAEDVHNHIRGLSPYPGAWTMHGKTLLKIYRSSVEVSAGAPGEVVEAGHRLVVACGSKSVELKEVQQQGRQRLSAADFLRGYDMQPGDRLT
ncbi:MAG: methionyl-tRNA formyltransferase [Bacteroidota bacterium]